MDPTAAPIRNEKVQYNMTFRESSNDTFQNVNFNVNDFSELAE